MVVHAYKPYGPDRRSYGQPSEKALRARLFPPADNFTMGAAIDACALLIFLLVVRGSYGSFPKIRGTLLFCVLIIRILLFRVLYWGPPLWETPLWGLGVLRFRV